MMRRRKPDLMLVLALLIGIGVLVTGFAQSAGNNGTAPPPATQTLSSR